ncbi:MULTISPECIES: MarR family winged helix-turn-helix transcriptional regulator [unclassified Rhodococcus (in: high G+C Gram-positive bacteria)]|uniref:MarR family winged helix-turn-helix transcriptional regulator n=1 Tax=unclassified Rhodococcus (in: high G+C Gram-positive bacteria) TaxID=192944 RepID=UPI00233F521D|nr:MULTISPECIES: MarR family transcriptional regulator [unclassified Rhodococcus (in: high G+C Gram-positive bacteria)]MDC3725309.1 MarR family transcriptional regulator [Rhodococcus sp. Rp3]WSE24748.1 MarR family transcriptional regulator [Rhodococcus sp. PD04]
MSEVRERGAADGPSSTEKNELGSVVETADVLYSLMSDFLRQLPRDLSLTASSTLSTLNRRGPQRITALAAAQGVTQPSMTSLVASLEKGGMVTRRHDPADARASLIELTDKGAEYVLERRGRGTDRIGGYIRDLPEAQRTALLAAFPALRTLEELAREKAL